jgi:hypothetical protein
MPAAAAWLGLLSVTGAARADVVSQARITLDAREAGTVTVRHDLTWTAGDGRSALTLYVSENVTVESARSGGAALDVTAAAPESGLRAWTLDLPEPLAAGASRMVSVQTTVAGTEMGADGGALLPGTGWFPRAAPEASELTPHTVTFLLPVGWTGIAAGERRGANAWEAEEPGRPYAVWGAFEPSDAQAEGAEGEIVSFQLWRRAGDGAEKPRPADLAPAAGIAHALEVAVGPARGNGPWKMIDLGEFSPVGGQRTVFWNEAAFAGGMEGEAAELRDRDLSGALAASVWTECVPFRGERAAFLSLGIALYLGDVAYTAWRDVAEPEELETVTIGARRTGFLQVASEDRPLAGLVPGSAAADRLIPTRGALVAHLLATNVASRPRWILHLREFRDAHEKSGGDWAAFSDSFRPEVLGEMMPYLDTTDVPDYYFGSHGPAPRSSISGRRYAVTVGNRGTTAGHAEIATYDEHGRLLQFTRAPLAPGEERRLQFGQPDEIARLQLEPRGMTPQYDISDERITLAPETEPTKEELVRYIPSYPFSVVAPGARRADGFSLELEGVTISDFDGWIVPYETKRGPSGACLLGSCTLSIHPGGDFTASWNEVMGEGPQVFEGTRGLFIRFPTARWKDIEPQLGRTPTPEEMREVSRLQVWVFQLGFAHYFHDGNEAQDPPAGSAMVTFRTRGGEWMGYARVPEPNGTVFARFWERLGQTSFWEDRR